MPTETIRYVKVWSGWVRLLHALLGMSVLFLIMSVWLLETGSEAVDFWRDWHRVIGQWLLIVVVARVILLFLLPDSGNWRALVPDVTQWRAAAAMLRYYLSLARAPLPNWYAHNPFWRPVYPLLLVVLLLCGLTGLWYQAPYTLLGLAMHEWHRLLASGVTAFAVAHILAVVMHDIRDRGGSISGIISGYRHFHVPQRAEKSASPFTGSTPPVYVSVDSIKRPRS